MSENDAHTDGGADAEPIPQSCSEKKKKKRKKKECICSDPATCKGLTAAFSILEDKRKRFVRIPHYSHSKPNLVREAYFKYLLPDHPIDEETSSRYIAAHHFDPIIVLSSHGSVPRTLTKHEATRLGLEDHELQDCMFNEEFLRKVFIVVPNYALEESKKDVTDILNQILRESGDEDADAVSLSKEDILDATVRVKAVQDDAAACNDCQNSQDPTEDLEGVLIRSFSEKQGDPPSPTRIRQDVESSLTTNEETHKSNPLGDDENDDLYFEDLPDDICIVSISGVNEDRRSQFSRASSEMCFSTPKALSTIAEIQQDAKPRLRPTIPRAQSEPILRTKRPCPRGILKRYPTAGTIREEHSVNFGTVEIREYPIMPGDNPGGICGPPVTIDWIHQDHMRAKIDEYEEARPERRSQAEFSMPSPVRQRLLRKSGYSLAHIQRSTKEANMIRKQRRSTAGFSHMYQLSVAKERWARSVSNATVKRGKKKKEREYIRTSLSLSRYLEKESSQSSLTDGGLSCDEESESTCTAARPFGGTSDEEASLTKLSSVYCCLKP